MASSPRPGPVRRLLARITPDPARKAAAPSNDPAPGGDLRLPEQRLLDVATRYGRLAVGDRPPTTGQTAAAAGFRIVAPTDPSDAGTPVWVRRLGDRDASTESGQPTGEAEPEPSVAGHGSRPR